MAYLLIGFSIVMAAVTFAAPSDRWRPWLLPLGAAGHLSLVLWSIHLSGHGTVLSGLDNWLLLDALGKVVLGFLAVLFFLCSLYAPGYLALRGDRPNRVFCANLFVVQAMMTLVALSHHLGLMWVAMEATTLASAPLLYFNHNVRSLEATWKYLLIGSVGIALALLGSFFLAYSSLKAGLESTLLFDRLIHDAPHLSPPWLHAAFVLLFIGYGTKMGLAPMHSWKPDAYGEAAGLVGTLLAGGITSCAFLAILRIYHICCAGAEAEFARQMMVGMGLLSMAVAAVFMVRQRDFKRMLAYSSVEHMGILVLGIGIGGLGVYGALLHLINNGLTKGVLFLSAGNIHRAYGSKLTDNVRGALRRVPLSGSLLLAGFLAITGSPPFGPFVSEFTIVNAAVASGQFLAVGLLLVLLAVVFVGMGATVLAVVLGNPPETPGPAAFRDSLSTGLPILLFMGLVLLMGLHVPSEVDSLLRDAAAFLEVQRMIGAGFVKLRNGQAIARAEVPEMSFADFRAKVVNAASAGQRVSALFGDDSSADGAVTLYAVLADSAHSLLRVAKTRLESDRFRSLTPDCVQVHLFEREMAEQFGVVPEGHPWFKPVRFHGSYRPGHDAWGRKPGKVPVVGVTDFYRIEGEEIHEVAVGPVHAGVIEPGHFRFQCHGEEVLHLEIALGYQHRGAERTLRGGPTRRTIHTMETVAGDTSVGHATAYCQAVESLAACRPTSRAEVLRGVALELERLANHTGDLGALAGDIGFLPTASYCGRLRGDFLNLTALLCGNRFGRSAIRTGGVGFDLDAQRLEKCRKQLDAIFRDVTGAVELLWNSPSAQARFEGTGALSRETCLALGLVGPAARACEVDQDVRQDFPAGIYRFAQVPVSTWASGDVFARAYVRWLEIQRTVAFLREQFEGLPEGPVRAAVGQLKPEHLVVTLVEGWRGEICHVALTNAEGKFARYKIIDPSFHNWTGLAMALRGEQISDFPLCNKSFNLSYCGHDL